MLTCAFVSAFLAPGNLTAGINPCAKLLEAIRTVPNRPSTIAEFFKTRFFTRPPLCCRTGSRYKWRSAVNDMNVAGTYAKTNRAHDDRKPPFDEAWQFCDEPCIPYAQRVQEQRSNS